MFENSGEFFQDFTVQVPEHPLVKEFRLLSRMRFFCLFTRGGQENKIIP